VKNELEEDLHRLVGEDRRRQQQRRRRRVRRRHLQQRRRVAQIAHHEPVLAYRLVALGSIIGASWNFS